MTTIAQLIGWNPLTQTAQVHFPFSPTWCHAKLTALINRTRQPYSIK